jgi:hypothetical protein
MCFRSHECESARGPDAHRHANLLIHLAVEEALLDAYSPHRLRSNETVEVCRVRAACGGLHPSDASPVGVLREPERVPATPPLPVTKLQNSFSCGPQFLRH